MLVRGHEDDVWGVVVERIEYAEAIEAAHLDIEKDDVGTRALDRGYRFASRRRFTDDLDTGLRLEQSPDSSARGRFVVNDERAQGVPPLL